MPVSRSWDHFYSRRGEQNEMVYVFFTHKMVENGVGHWTKRSYDGLSGQKHNLRCFVVNKNMGLVEKTPCSTDDILMSRIWLVESRPLIMTELELQPFFFISNAVFLFSDHRIRIKLRELVCPMWLPWLVLKTIMHLLRLFHGKFVQCCCLFIHLLKNNLYNSSKKHIVK